MTIDTTTPVAPLSAGYERLASLPAAAAFLRDVQAMTSPGRPLYGMAGRAAEVIDEVRRELARIEAQSMGQRDFSGIDWRRAL